jgi:hypothetical protein
MRKLERRRWPLTHTGSALLAVVLAAGALVASAAIAEVYSWRTEDGGYAFTDDPKAVPARYADQVKTRKSASLDAYPRYTPEDSAATSEHAERMAARLERLRRINATPDAGAGTTASSGGARSASISVSTGRRDGQRIDISTDEGEGPMVIERLRMIGDGKATTSPATVVKRGDKVVAIIKGRSNETDLSDIVAEDELADQ